MANKQRELWIDNAKAIAIFLVVLGHMNSLNDTAKIFIYSFHLPLFMMITGYLTGGRKKKINVPEFSGQTLFPLIKLYFFFSILAIPAWYILEQMGADFIVMLAPLKGMLYGTHGADMLFIHNNDPLWYFPFLITSLMLYFALAKFDRVIGYGTLGILCAIALLYDGMRLPWSLDVAPFGAIFIMLGYEFKRAKDYIKSPIIWMVGLFILGAMIVYWNGSTNLNRAEFGDIPILYPFAAVVLSVSLLLLCRYLPTTKLAQSLSMHTLVIFCTHIYFVKFFKAIPMTDSDFINQIIILMGAVIITAICLVGSIITMPYIQKYIMGKR